MVDRMIGYLSEGINEWLDANLVGFSDDWMICCLGDQIFFGGVDDWMIG